MGWLFYDQPIIISSVHYNLIGKHHRTIFGIGDGFELDVTPGALTFKSEDSEE